MADLDSKINKLQDKLESIMENGEMISPGIQRELDEIPVEINDQKKVLQCKLMTLDALLSEGLFFDYAKNTLTNLPAWDIEHYKNYARAVLNLVVFDQGKVVGTGEAILRDYFISGGNSMQDSGVVVLSNGSVLPAYQRKGIGTTMMDRAFETLKDNILAEIIEGSREGKLIKGKKSPAAKGINKPFLIEAVSKDNLTVFADFRDPGGYLPKFILSARKYGFNDQTQRAKNLLNDYAELGFIGDNIIFFLTAEQFPHAVYLDDNKIQFNTRMNRYSVFELYSPIQDNIQNVIDYARSLLENFQINPNSNSYTFRGNIQPVKEALGEFDIYLKNNNFQIADFGININPLTDYEAAKKLTIDNSKKYGDYEPDPDKNIAVVRPMPPSVRAAVTSI